MSDSISIAQARRLALGAQGFTRPRPAAVGARQLNATIDRLRLLQLDSVNVFERSHYLPLFARLGSYDKDLLDRLTFRSTGERTRYLEYWGHEATLLPVDLWPLMQWKMARFRQKDMSDQDAWSRQPANARMLAWVRAELAEQGPMAASEVEHEENVRHGPWWGWSSVKQALELLFRWGEVVSAGRTRFERRYALPEQVLPRAVLDAPTPEPEDARRELVRQAVRAHGVGTVGHLADYFRMRVDVTAAALRELVEAGEARAVTVRGWDRPAYLDAAASIPRRVRAAALLSPFDPVVWERDRTLRLFGMHYRIEIYTPAPKRRFGYYTLPLLVDDGLVGRVDLKSDRQRGVLRVQSAWWQDGMAGAEASHGELAARVAPLLRETAAWQGLGGVEVYGWGSAAGDLADALGIRVLPSDAPAARRHGTASR